jgi:hypothetical protein
MRRRRRRPRLAAAAELGDQTPRRTLLWEPCLATALVLLSGWLASELRRDAGQLATSTARATSELETLAGLHRAVHAPRRGDAARAHPLSAVAATMAATVLVGEASSAGRGLSVDLHRGCAALVLQSDAAAAVAPR